MAFEAVSFKFVFYFLSVTDVMRSSSVNNAGTNGLAINGHDDKVRCHGFDANRIG